MDSIAIETISISAVKNSIAITDYLSPFISENDKEPSWDGFVYLYNKKTKKKQEIQGRIPVQVKGKIAKRLTAATIKYSVYVSDLRNYLYDGGVIFFVVLISQNGSNTTIYYANLLPVNLRLILSESKSNKSKMIELKKFPTDNNQKATIFFNFNTNKVKQASFVSAELLSLDELKKSGLLESISIPVSGYGLDKNDPQKLLFNSDFYMYANIKGGSIPQPLEMLPVDIHIAREVDNDISVNGMIYYRKYTVVRTKEKFTLQFGKIITVDIIPEQKNVKLHYRASGFLRERAKDLRFLIDIIDIKSFEIDDLPFHLSPTEKKLENFHPVETKKELFQINRIIQMLDLLNVKDDIRISELSVEDYRNLDRLTCAFIDKCPVNGLNPDLHPISVLQIQISNIKLALSFIRNKNNSDEYCIYDYFKTRFDVFSQDANGEEYPTSQYQILRSKDFVELSNIDFDVLLPSYQSIEENVVSISHANNTLLELLLAFDRNPKRKSDIINVAKEFAEWLLHVDDNNLPPEFKILNMLQVTKREREFTIEEIKSLCAITENSSMREDILTGAYLLLGNHVAAKIHFEKIEPKLREDFREYPIFHFWKQSDGGMDNE